MGWVGLDVPRTIPRLQADIETTQPHHKKTNPKRKKKGWRKRGMIIDVNANANAYAYASANCPREWNAGAHASTFARAYWRGE